ncbi:outer membrane beta-barrel protein [bacterium]|nr:outer membrane beta-barrel protein [bacterium]
MRYFSTAFLLAVLVLCGLSDARADRGGHAELSLAVGGAIPDETFGESASSGAAFDVGFGFYLSPNFLLGLEVGGRAYEPTRELQSLAMYLTQDPNAEIGIFASHVSVFTKIFFTPQPVTGYMKLGIGSGTTEVSLSARGVEESESISDVTFSIGVGIQADFNEVLGGFFEAGYRSLASQENEGLANTEIQAGIQIRL